MSWKLLSIFYAFLTIFLFFHQVNILTHTAEVDPGEDNKAEIKIIKSKMREQDLAELSCGGAAATSGHNEKVYGKKDDDISDDVCVWISCLVISIVHL